MIILRIIIAIILLFIYMICILITPNKYVYILTKYFTTLLLYVCKLSKINVINKHLFNHYCRKDKPVIIVANHTSLWDGIIMNSVFGKVRYLAAKNADKVFVGGKYCLEKLGCVTVKENGTVKTIQEHIKNRKADDGILVIFPDAMDPIPLGTNIAPFKTGAFATGFDILPVVIKYKNYTINPTFYWYKNENPFHAWIKIMLNDSININVKVLPLIKASSNIINMKDTVYNSMSECLKTL